MATVILVRHGRTTANATGLLAGRAPGVRLDEVGREQAAAAGLRLAGVPLARVVTSPLERCGETTAALLGAQGAGGATEAVTDDGVIECGYGDWTGRSLRELNEEPLWKVVQAHPSSVTFPGGESMAGMQARAVAAVRRHDAEVEAEHGPHAVWAVVSHGDIIKSVLADALGMHLDLFQRLSVGPASLSIVRYGSARPEVVATNTESGDLSWLAAAPTAGPAGSTVGGGAGHPTPGAAPAERS
jgi:probable phosphomutase (TIGR03848 family)